MQNYKQAGRKIKASFNNKAKIQTKLAENKREERDRDKTKNMGGQMNKEQGPEAENLKNDKTIKHRS